MTLWNNISNYSYHYVVVRNILTVSQAEVLLASGHKFQFFFPDSIMNTSDDEHGSMFNSVGEKACVGEH
jgi:hypothetical protein